jgi:hypothetical protein
MTGPGNPASVFSDSVNGLQKIHDRTYVGKVN